MYFIIEKSTIKARESENNRDGRYILQYEQRTLRTWSKQNPLTGGLQFSTLVDRVDRDTHRWSNQEVQKTLNK